MPGEFDWSGPFKAIRTVTWTLALLCVAALVFSGQNNNLQLYDAALRDLRFLQHVRVVDERLFWRLHVSDEAFESGNWKPVTAGDLDPLMPQTIGFAQEHPTLHDQLDLRGVLGSMGFSLPDNAQYYSVGAFADQRWERFDPEGLLSNTLPFLGSGEPVIRMLIPDVSEAVVAQVRATIENDISSAIPSDQVTEPVLRCTVQDGCHLTALISIEQEGGALRAVEVRWPSRIVNARMSLLPHELPFFGSAPDFQNQINDRAPMVPYLSLMRLYDEVSDRTRLEAVSHIQSLRSEALNSELDILGVSINARTMPIMAPLIIVLAQLFLLIQCRALRQLQPPAESIREQFVAPLIYGWGGTIVRVVLCLLLPIAALWGPLIYKFVTTNMLLGWVGALVDVTGTYAIGGYMPSSLVAAGVVLLVSLACPVLAVLTIVTLQTIVREAREMGAVAPMG